MSFATRLKKLTSYIYSPTNPASEDAIRGQIDNSIQEVYDNVQTALADTTGASQIGYSGSYATVEAGLQAFESGGSGTIPPDESITNDKLATDVKVGSLALLNTTVKSDVVSSINEVDDNSNTNATDIDNLENTVSYETTVSGTDALTITTVNGGFTFAVGKSVKGIAVANNTGAMTANIDGDGATTIKKLDGSTLVDTEADDFEDKKPFELICQNDGADFFLLAPRGGKNPLKDWLNETSAYENSQGTISTTLVGSVTGAGWIIALHTTSTPNDMALHVDGSPYLGDNGNNEVVEVDGNLLIMKRYETGFDYYSETTNTNMVVYLEGDKFEEAVMKVLTDYVTETSSTTVVNVTGEGWFYGGYSRGNGTTLTIDSVNIFSDLDIRWLTTLVKFNSSLLVENEPVTRVSFHYTLNP